MANFFNRRGEAALPDLPQLPQLPKLPGMELRPRVVREVPKVAKARKKVVKKSVKKVAHKTKLKKGAKRASVRSHKLVKHVKSRVAPKVKKNLKSAVKVVSKSLSKVKLAKEKEVKNKGALEDYKLEIDGAHAKVEILKNEEGITYNLFIPGISPVTSIFLDEIRNELISATTVSTKELTDPTLFFKIKMRFMEDARRLLREKLPHTKKEVEDYLVGTLMQDMLGLGKIEFLISDPNLEEIVIPSAKEKIRVYYKKYGWLLTNIRVGREEEIVNYSNIIARRVGRQISVLNPLLDAHLVTGDRINSVLYPISTKGNTITIRKFARDPFTIIDMINNKTCNLEIAALLWLAIEYEMNVLISGGTGSGKTSFLNACMPFIPPNQRIISIEDTRELMLPEFLYWAPLVTRIANPEGKGEVSMLDLLVNSLRMRPDRIILGEMRKEKEAMVLFEAMHTGHSVYSTVHADSAPETISRLVNPPLNVPPNLLKTVNLNVVMFRDRRKNTRRVLQVAEFEADKLGAKANILYRLAAERDEIIKHSESLRFFEDMTRNTGMSENEINAMLKEKRDILDWMIKNGMRSLDEMGRVTNLYYTNKELLLKAIKENKKDLILKKFIPKNPLGDVLVGQIIEGDTSEKVEHKTEKEEDVKGELPELPKNKVEKQKQEMKK